MNVLRPLVTLPSEGQAIVDLLALLVAADLRTGGARTPTSELRFFPDAEGRDLLLSPEETIEAGGGDCARLVRLEAAFRGDEIAAVRNQDDTGWHVFLRENGEPIDPCVERGAAPPDSPTFYERSPVAARIVRPAVPIVPTSSAPAGIVERLVKAYGPAARAEVEAVFRVARALGTDKPLGDAAAEALESAPEADQRAIQALALVAAAPAMPAAAATVSQLRRRSKLWAARLAAAAAVLGGGLPSASSGAYDQALQREAEKVAGLGGCPGTCAVRRRRG